MLHFRGNVLGVQLGHNALPGSSPWTWPRAPIKRRSVLFTMSACLTPRARMRLIPRERSPALRSTEYLTAAMTDVCLSAPGVQRGGLRPKALRFSVRPAPTLVLVFACLVSLHSLVSTRSRAEAASSREAVAFGALVKCSIVKLSVVLRDRQGTLVELAAHLGRSQGFWSNHLPVLRKR